MKGLFKYVEIEGSEEKINELESLLGLEDNVMKKGAFKKVLEERGAKR